MFEQSPKVQELIIHYLRGETVSDTIHLPALHFDSKMKKYTFIILCGISSLTFSLAVFLYVFNTREEYRFIGFFHQLEINGPVQLFLVKGLGIASIL